MQTAYRKAQLEFLDKGTKNNTEFALIPFKHLLGRAYEMSQCTQVESIDTITAELLRMYNSAQAFVESAMNDRYLAFIKRHNLRDQFIKEDEGGER